MNFLLVMPKLLGSIDHFDIFPIGLAYISASLKNAGYSVITANLDYYNGDTYLALKQLISDHNISVIGTGGLSRDFKKIKDVIDVARTLKPGIISIVGGGIISSDPIPAMQALNADIGVIGEGESTICELAGALEGDESIAHITGIIYRALDGRLIVTPPRQEISNIDDIPFPDFDAFNYGEWVSKSNTGLILTDRSCPFRCTFCFHPSGDKYRQRSLDNIFNEIEYQIEHYKISSLSLSSELFSISKIRIAEFCERIKPYKLSWGCCLRVSDVDEDILKTMKSVGCVNIVFGLESADDSILKSMKKGITVKQIERVLELTYEAEIMIEAGFIFGDIVETQRTVDRTLAFWKKHRDTSYLNLSMISVLPRSFLYNYACENGIIHNREQFLYDGCPPVNVSTLSPTEYNELTAKIAELRLHPHVPAKLIQIDDVNSQGESTLTFTCRKCGERNKSSVPFWFGKEIRCSKCNLINFVDPFEAAIYDMEAFVKYLPMEQDVVLWGAGGIYYKLMQKYPVLTNDRFILVDANKAQHGFKICGKIVHSTNIVNDNSINTVVITALSRKDDIVKTINNNFETVKLILVPTIEITNFGIVPVLLPTNIY